MAQVTIGCKLPHGLQLVVEDKSVNVFGQNSTEIIGGYGLTKVDQEFAEKWFKDNADHPAVKNKLLYIEKSNDKARDKAKDQESVKSGTEALDPKANGVEEAKEE